MRIFLVLAVLFSSFQFSWAQDEIDEEFFEDDEPIIDPLEEPLEAPPTWEGEDPSAQPANPRTNIMPRPSGGYPGAGAAYIPPSGIIEFRLANPPQFKPTQKPVRIPERIRKQVEDNLKRQSKLDK